jgi:hypothetical protein
VRFAFYGRVSTLEYQDPESSLGWQRDSALDMIADRGRIVAEFFDVGYSRTVPWARRRQAARLLEAVTNPRRGFDAIIVGESERAFTGTQLLHLAQVFLAHGVQVWLPELDGPVDLTDPAHQGLIMWLGERSRREVARARHRTTAAMRAQRWIFAQRLTGHSLAGIARDLNDRGVPCPSQADRPRNRHRHGGAWTRHTSAHPANDHEDRERAVYLREDQLLRDLASALRRGSGPPPAPQEVPAMLRERKITIVCSHTHRALVPANAGPPSLMGQLCVRGSTQTETQPGQRLAGTIHLS